MSTSKIHEVVYNEKLREQMTMLMKFKLDANNVLWRLLCMNTSNLPANLNRTVLARHRDRLALMTGIHYINNVDKNSASSSALFHARWPCAFLQVFCVFCDPQVFCVFCVL